MSTRTNIHFTHGNAVHANIYRHSDGYPGEVKNGEVIEGGVLADLLKFFRQLKAEVRDTRFRDAEFLGAKFLVWQAKELARRYKGFNDETKEFEYEDTHYLEFLGVSPCIRDHGDIEYVYKIDCDKPGVDGFPLVSWKPATPGARYRKVRLEGTTAVDDQTLLETA